MDNRGIAFRFPAGATGFLSSTVSRLALGPTQPPTQWIPGFLSPRVKRPGCEQERTPPYIPRLIMRGIIPPLPHPSSWGGPELSTGTTLPVSSSLLHFPALKKLKFCLYF
jgi:hypothetical protein